MLDPEELRKMLSYNPETGVLTWRDYPHPTRRVGDIILQQPNSNGYLTFYVFRRKLYAHRAAWALTYGRWPTEVDHRNGVRTDNRLCNLREVTRSQNEMNAKLRQDSTSGYKGVSWHKQSGHWYARIMLDGKRVSLGFFPSAAAAHRAYCAASLLLFGEYRRAA